MEQMIVDGGVSINLKTEVLKALSPSKPQDGLDVMHAVKRSVALQVSRAAEKICETYPGFVPVCVALSFDINFDAVKTILEDLVVMGRAKEVGHYDPRKYIKVY